MIYHLIVIKKFLKSFSSIFLFDFVDDDDDGLCLMMCFMAFQSFLSLIYFLKYIVQTIKAFIIYLFFFDKTVLNNIHFNGICYKIFLLQ